MFPSPKWIWACVESVEDRIKWLAILVGILFIKDEELLTHPPADVAGPKNLYAMVIIA